MNIFVGNLSYSSTDEGIRTLFEAYGEVASAKIINNRDTGRSRGFAFVEMPNDSEAKAAIEALNGRELDGRSIRVSEAQERGERESRERGSGGVRRERSERAPRAAHQPERFRIDGNYRRDRE